jgi:hypothetical protein
MQNTHAPHALQHQANENQQTMKETINSAINGNISATSNACNPHGKKRPRPSTIFHLAAARELKSEGNSSDDGSGGEGGLQDFPSSTMVVTSTPPSELL